MSDIFSLIQISSYLPSFSVGLRLKKVSAGGAAVSLHISVSLHG